MKKICVFLLVMAAFLSAATVTVDGYAYLEGQTDHTGIEVFFQRVAPDADYSYTVYTNSLGYYTCDIETGVYDLNFSKTSYSDGSVSGVSCYSNTTIDNVTLIPDTGLSGSISGLLTKGVYVVNGPLQVDAGEVLSLEAGVTLNFLQDMELVVNGKILAYGTEGDSVYFTSPDSVRWEGLTFSYANDQSVLDHVVVERAVNPGIHFDHSDSLKIMNSSIRNNQLSTTAFGGVNISYSSSCIIENSEIYDNSRYGLLSLNGENVSVINSKFFNNSHSHVYIWGGNVSFEGCEFYYENFTANNAQIDVAYSSNLDIKNCVFRDIFNLESALDFTDMHSTLNLENSIFINNKSSYVLNISGGNINIRNCSFVNNTGSCCVRSKYTTDMNINNSIFHSNKTTYLIMKETGEPTNTLEVSNCNFGINDNNTLYGCSEYLGIDVTENANGYPCDPWLNITADPEFNSPDTGDLRIVKSSPCRDAGSNSFVTQEYDFRGEGYGRMLDEFGDPGVVDIGPYEWNTDTDPLTSIEDGTGTVTSISLAQNYPNPFNPVTTINYALPNTSQIELNVYNLNGQLVQSLVNGKMEKGSHKIEFNGADLTSGMYVYNLKVDGKSVLSRKMMLLK